MNDEEAAECLGNLTMKLKDNKLFAACGFIVSLLDSLEYQKTAKVLESVIGEEIGGIK